MSMIGNFLQLKPAELDTLIANPADVESFIYPNSKKGVLMESCDVTSGDSLTATMSSGSGHAI